MIKKTNFAAPSYGRKRKPIFGERGRARFFSSLFIAPSLIGLLVFFVIPFFVIAYYSVIDNPVSGEFVGLDNFIKIWNNTAFRLAAKNTLTFSAVSVPLAVVLSLLLASSLLTDIPMKSRFRAFFLSPLMVPAASVVLVWQVLFHYNGALNDLVVFFGGAAQDWLKSPYSQLVIAALFLWKNLGYNMILFMSALSSIPKEQIESAQVDGAGKLTIFFKIKLRYLSSSILFVTILSLISSF